MKFNTRNQIQPKNQFNNRYMVKKLYKVYNQLIHEEVSNTKCHLS